MSDIIISGTLLLGGDLISDGDVTLNPGGTIIPLPDVKSKEAFIDYETGKAKFTNGLGRKIISIHGDIEILGSINGYGKGFGPNGGPGANSLLLNNMGFPERSLGATHAGRGGVDLVPVVESDGMIIDYITLTYLQEITHSARLSGIVLFPSSVSLTIVHGSAQYLGTDFYIEGRDIKWGNGSSLENILEVGDILRVQYIGNASYTPPTPLPPYGSKKGPTSYGSGSGSPCTPDEAHGGGAIKLQAKVGEVIVGGVIDMDGESGTGISGGGAGGSVWIVGDRISGSGTVTSRGGAGDALGGSGGYFTRSYLRTDTFSGTESVAGGTLAENGVITSYQIKPILQDKFTGSILNSKWWEMLDTSSTINNVIGMDSPLNEFSHYSLQSKFTLSGRNILSDLDYTALLSEITCYDASFLLYVDERNYVGISKKYGGFFGVYSIDGVKSQTALSESYVSATLRILKQEEVFTFQFFESSDFAKTIFSQSLPVFDKATFKIRVQFSKSSSEIFSETLALTDQDVLNKFITLSCPPVDSSEVALNILGGPSQIFGTDYYVDGTTLRWDSAGLGVLPPAPLENVLGFGDELRTVYKIDSTANALDTNWDNFKVYDGILFEHEIKEPVVYVDSVYGEDLGSGQALSPLKNLFVATAVAKHGGVIVLRDGTHNPTEVLGKDLTIRGSNGGTSYITSRDSTDSTGSNWEHSALTFCDSQGIVKGVNIVDSSAGISLVECSKNFEIYDNNIFDVETGVEIFESSKITIRKNKIFDSTTGITSEDTRDLYLYGNVSYGSNLFLSSVGSKGVLGHSNTLDEDSTGFKFTDSTGLILSNNISNGELSVNSINSTVSSLRNNLFGTTVEATGPVDSSANISVDPGFVNGAGRDYHLLSDSSLINVGIDVDDRFRMDFDGVNRSLVTPQDLGAFEYVDTSHSGGEYFVAGAGDDLVNSGNEADPFRTLDKAFKVADSTINIDGGHYDSFYLNLTSNNVSLNDLTVFTTSINHVVTYITLEEYNIVDKYIPLPGFIPGPNPDWSNIAVNMVSGPSQVFGVDYSVEDGFIVWGGFGLEGVLGKGDTMRIVYHGELQSKALNTFTLHSHYSNLTMDSSRQVFVSESGGSDEYGTGSVDSPYRSVQKGLDESNPSDHIVLFAGSYSVFNGLNDRTLVPLSDKTSVINLPSRRVIEDFFSPRDFREFNHVDFDQTSWAFEFTPDSSARINGGYLTLTSDGYTPVSAETTFSFSKDFEISAEILHSGIPLTFSVYNADNTATLRYDQGDTTSTFTLDGNIFESFLKLPVPFRSDQFFSDYINVTKELLKNKKASLTLVPRKSLIVAVNIVGGPPLEYGIDFIVKGNEIIWNGLGLECLDIGDKLRAVYQAEHLSSPVKITASYHNNTFIFKAYDYSQTIDIYSKDILLNNEDGWKASFYLDGTTAGFADINPGFKVFNNPTVFPVSQSQSLMSTDMVTFSESPEKLYISTLSSDSSPSLSVYDSSAGSWLEVPHSTVFSGFGDDSISSLEVHDGTMFAATNRVPSLGGSRVAYKPSGMDWTGISNSALFGIDSTLNSEVLLKSLGGSLYISASSVNGSHVSVFSSGDPTLSSSWSDTSNVVVFPLSGGANTRIDSMEIYDGKIAVGSYNPSGGAVSVLEGPVWQDSGYPRDNTDVLSFEVFEDKLFAGVKDELGASVFFYDSNKWREVSNGAVFPDSSNNNTEIQSMAPFEGKLFVASKNTSGSVVSVFSGGDPLDFSNWDELPNSLTFPDTSDTAQAVAAMSVYDGKLFLGNTVGSEGSTTGATVSVFSGGNTTSALNWDELPNSTVLDTFSDHFRISSMIVHDSTLFMGTEGVSDTVMVTFFGSDPTLAGNWNQITPNIFFDAVSNKTLTSMVVFNNMLLIGSDNTSSGAHISYLEEGTVPTIQENWIKMNSDSFFPDSSTANRSVTSMVVHTGRLFISSGSDSAAHVSFFDTGALYLPGDWTEFSYGDVFDNVNNTSINVLKDFKGRLYAGTRNETDGAEIRRFVTWHEIPNSVVFPDSSSKNLSVSSLIQYGDNLFVGSDTDSGFDGAVIGQYFKGSIAYGPSWKERSNTEIFPLSTTDSTGIGSMTVFQDKIYIGSRNTLGATLSSFDGGFFREISNSLLFENVSPSPTDNVSISSMKVFGEGLYMGTENPNGSEIVLKFFESESREYGKGFISRFLAISKDFEGTSEDKDLLVRTERSPVIFHKDAT